MAGLFDEVVLRPWAAILNGLEAFGGSGGATERAEQVLARMAHGLTVAPAGRDKTMTAQPAIANSGPRVSSVPPALEVAALTLPSVSDYLEKGLDLKRWWDQVSAETGDIPQDQQFPLIRAYNRATRAYGFFGEAPVRGKMMRVMGNVQELFFDQPRGPAAANADHVEWIRAQLEEFVLKYFMRISSFRPPDVFVDTANPTPPPALERLSWCPTASEERVGFGFSQLFNKKKGADTIDPFQSYDEHAIVDQRDVGRLFEWLLLKVRIFDFAFKTRPFGQGGPELVFGLNEESYLVVQKEFIKHEYRPPNIHGGAFKILADYGIGYAFVKNPIAGPFAYGPGEFDAAIELINFRIYETGYISVRMIFVANRPTQTLNLTVDPIDWSFQIADAFSMGLASRMFAPAKTVLERIPFRFSFDPVSLYLAGTNLVSGGAAARTLCISQETLDKLFLAQHFRQHYQTVLGSTETWLTVPDWLDTKWIQVEKPWIISGLSS